MDVLKVFSLAVVGACGVGRGAVVVRETYDEPGTQALSYYAFNGGSAAVEEGRLRVSGGTGKRFGTSGLGPISLANVGDRLSFSFEAEMVGNAGFQSFQIGLFTSGATKVSGAGDGANAADDQGAYFNVRFDPSTSGLFCYDEGNTLVRDAGEAGRFVGTFAQPGGVHSMEFALTRRAGGLFRLEIFRDGVGGVVSDFDLPTTTVFDNLQFGFLDSQAPSVVFLDNVTVSYTAVPEPGGVAAASVVATGLLRRRR